MVCALLRRLDRANGRHTGKCRRRVRTFAGDAPVTARRLAAPRRALVDPVRIDSAVGALEALSSPVRTRQRWRMPLSRLARLGSVQGTRNRGWQVKQLTRAAAAAVALVQLVHHRPQSCECAFESAGFGDIGVTLGQSPPGVSHVTSEQLSYDVRRHKTYHRVH